MRTYLFTPYYRDNRPARRKELDTCLRHNLENKEIDGAWIMTESEVSLKHPKLSVIHLDHRPTYKDFFDLAKLTKGLNILANADIFFLPQDIKKLKEIDYTETVVTLTRWNVNKKGLPTHYSRNGQPCIDSQDVWTFKIPPKVHYCDFPLGNLGCDNRIAYEIEKAGYQLINPSLNIKAYHLHNSGQRNWSRNRKEDTVPEPYRRVPVGSFCELPKKPKLLHVSLHQEKNPMFKGFQKVFKCKNFLFNKEKEHRGIEGMKKKLLQVNRKFKPDVTFMQLQSEILDPHTVSKLNGSVIQWTGDVRDPIPAYMEQLAEVVDRSCFSNQTDVEKYAERRATYLQIGYNPDLYKPEGATYNIPDVVFMGNHYDSRFPLSKFRYDMAHALHSHFGDRFLLCGNGWNIPAKKIESGSEAEALVYRSTKIAINANHFSYSRFTSDRMYRIMGCGCFCLTKWFPDIEKDFIDKKNIVTFNNIDELIYLVNYYLEHEEERKKIAKAGHELVKNRDTWEHMAKKVYRLAQIRYPKAVPPKSEARIAPRQEVVTKQEAREERMQNVELSLQSGYKNKLSILIPTIKKREEKFMSLLGELIRQINRNNFGRLVQVLHIQDRGKEEETYYPIGKKRNDLLRLSTSEWVVFLDDDDLIHADYVKLILGALEDKPDCVTFNGEITFKEGKTFPYNFALKFKEYRQDPKTLEYQRPPGHLTPIRRDIAIKHKFHEYSKERDKGSDVHWSLDIVRAKDLKTAVHIKENLYHYLCDTTKTD